MDLQESDREIWSFEASCSHGSPERAPQYAKSKVSSEEDIPYEQLSAKLVKTRWNHGLDSVVVVRTG